MSDHVRLVKGTEKYVLGGKSLPKVTPVEDKLLDDGKCYVCGRTKDQVEKLLSPVRSNSQGVGKAARAAIKETIKHQTKKTATLKKLTGHKGLEMRVEHVRSERKTLEALAPELKPLNEYLDRDFRALGLGDELSPKLASVLKAAIKIETDELERLGQRLERLGEEAQVPPTPPPLSRVTVGIPIARGKETLSVIGEFSQSAKMEGVPTPDRMEVDLPICIFCSDMFQRASKAAYAVLQEQYSGDQSHTTASRNRS